VRKVLAVTAITAVGTALLSCTASQPPLADASPTPPIVYGARASVVHAPLPPPVGYASPAPLINAPMPLASYGNPPNERAEPQTAAPQVWRASPRWAAVRGKGCIVVEQNPQAKFAVENCAKEDVDELTSVQLNEPRGY
jgi:hypothetical protein